MTETKTGSAQGVRHCVSCLERWGGRNKVLLCRSSECFGDGCLRMTPKELTRELGRDNRGPGTRCELLKCGIWGLNLPDILKAQENSYIRWVRNCDQL